jgi:hypothetical protein
VAGSQESILTEARSAATSDQSKVVVSFAAQQQTLSASRQLHQRRCGSPCRRRAVVPVPSIAMSDFVTAVSLQIWHRSVARDDDEALAFYAPRARVRSCPHVRADLSRLTERKHPLNDWAMVGVIVLRGRFTHECGRFKHEYGHGRDSPIHLRLKDNTTFLILPAAETPGGGASPFNHGPSVPCRRNDGSRVSDNTRRR